MGQEKYATDCEFFAILFHIRTFNTKFVYKAAY
jgi:hypothetical protein